MKSCHIGIYEFEQNVNIDLNKELLTNKACISITDLDQEDVVIHSDWKQSLSLKFYDVDTPDAGYKMFDEGQAKQVIDFMIDVVLDGTIDELIIHCHAGISRSRALHNFFQYYIVKDHYHTSNPPATIGNAHVYNTLVKVYYDH